MEDSGAQNSGVTSDPQGRWAVMQQSLGGFTAASKQMKRTEEAAMGGVMQTPLARG